MTVSAQSILAYLQLAPWSHKHREEVYTALVIRSGTEEHRSSELRQRVKINVEIKIIKKRVIPTHAHLIIQRKIAPFGSLG